MAAGAFSWPQPVEGLETGLLAVDHLMLKTVGNVGLGSAAADLINTGGKRLRPALTLTAAALVGQINKGKPVQTAAAIELVHLASLVHDDLLDDAPLRRDKLSMAAAKGPGFALLLGDYLLAKALSLAAAAGAEISVMISDTIAGMAEGEALELRGNVPSDPLSAGYFKIIQLKTAALFAAAAAAGAICSNLPPKTVEALRLYGQDFGIGFQLADDIADQKIDKTKKVAALKEINRRIKNTECRLAGMDGEAVDSLSALPQAYFDWAYPL